MLESCLPSVFLGYYGSRLNSQSFALYSDLKKLKWESSVFSTLKTKSPGLAGGLSNKISRLGIYRSVKIGSWFLVFHNSSGCQSLRQGIDEGGMICQTSRTNSSQMYPSNASFHLFKLILMRPVAPLPTLNVSSPVLTTSCTGISIVALKFNGLLIMLPILFLTRCGSVKLMEEKNGQTCLWLKIKKIVDNVLHQHFPPDCVH